MRSGIQALRGGRYVGGHAAEAEARRCVAYVEADGRAARAEARRAQLRHREALAARRLGLRLGSRGGRGGGQGGLGRLATRLRVGVGVGVGRERRLLSSALVGTEGAATDASTWL